MRTPARLLIAAVSALVVLASCQKEVDLQFDRGGNGNGNGNGNGGGGSTTNKIEGDYNFVGLKVYQTASATATDAGISMKMDVVTNYQSSNNTGTVKITSDKMSFTQVGCNLSGIVTLKVYMGGVLMQSQDTPISEVVSPADNITGYTRNNADSLTFAGQPSIYDGGAAVNLGNMGARISWSGDTLILKTTVDLSGTQAGFPDGVKGIGISTMKLKKK